MNSTSYNCAALCLVLMLAGCSTKPPPAATASSPPAAPAPAPAVTQTTIVPGSARDFQVNVGDSIHFDYDRFAIGSSEQAILIRQAEWLNRYPPVHVSIEGHCDERGTRAYNLALGARRAEAVKQFLEQRGIAATRMTTISYGKERPLCVESTEWCWAQNRRAVTIISAANS